MALDEYALVFFTLLNEAYRARFKHYLMLVNIACSPKMDAEARNQFTRQLMFASQDPSDILKPSGKGSSPAELKKFFNGK